MYVLLSTSLLICYIFIVQGKHLEHADLSDYHMTIGDALCIPVGPLTDNELYCKPPTTRPNKGKNDACPRDSLELHVSDYHAKLLMQLLEITY